MGTVELGRLLRTARGDESLRDVSSRAGVGLSYYHRVERGQVRRPGADRLGRIAGALGLDRAQVLRAAGYL